MCVIGVYIPHRFRKHAPFQQDTLAQLRAFVNDLPPSMCRVILGDFNCKLAREMKELTGRYSMHQSCDIGGLQLADLMQEQGLTATSTFFRPKHSLDLGSATYLSAKETQKASQIDYILSAKASQEVEISGAVRLRALGTIYPPLWVEI